ncbi:TPA: hypothetical protein DCE37_01980 [Candidatus Latescibacteria bacterium]|nr:hypothetical protein [Candidatus Latescibacterota bacterium]
MAGTRSSNELTYDRSVKEKSSESVEAVSSNATSTGIPTSPSSSIICERTSPSETSTGNAGWMLLGTIGVTLISGIR